MSVVVADTSPLNYLILCGVVHILPSIFGQIIIPPAVHAELGARKSPSVVRAWAAQPPPWVKIQRPLNNWTINLDPGESEAITLAEEIEADFVLVDEVKGRLAAMRKRLRVMGTIGVLETAHLKGHLHFDKIVEQLLQTNFRIDVQLLQNVRHRLNLD